MPKGGSKPGERRGGRQKGTPNRSTADIKALAQVHGAEAIAELARIMLASADERTRVAAAKELLDRGYGKATQVIAGQDGAGIVFKVYGFDPDSPTNAAATPLHAPGSV